MADLVLAVTRVFPVEVAVQPYMTATCRYRVFFVSIFTVQSYCHVSVLALCTGVPWRARPEAVLSLIICLTAGRSAFLKHVAACLFLGWAVQFTKGGHTTTLAQVMLSAASGTPQWCTRRLKLALLEYSSVSQ